jgi:peptide/nickel transport system ATP-binding protein
LSTVEVADLRVELTPSGEDVVDEVSFHVEAGEILGIVGETGSGKTTVAHALVGHARRGARIAHGSVRIDGDDILALPAHELRAWQGKVMSYVPQDPPAALNPALKIGRQIDELLQFHASDLARGTRRERVQAALDEVALPADDAFLARYPHQLSGGQQQRVVLAMAFILRPKLVVLDEPTTGLDVTTQAQVLRFVLKLCEDHGVAAVYVTHDLAVIARIASRSMVMYSGRVSEMGPTSTLFAAAAHPYTRRLIEATPDPNKRQPMVAIAGLAARPGHRPSGCVFHPRCEYAEEACRTSFQSPVRVGTDHLSWCRRTEELVGRYHPRVAEPAAGGVNGGAGTVLRVEGLCANYGQVQVVADVSFALHERECLALVGESGSGKTTVAKCIAGLHVSGSGLVSYRGIELASRARERSREARRHLQYIFQSPYNSLNPRQSVDDIVALPIRFFFDKSRREARRRAAELLERVGLPRNVVGRYPDELSGGERQRVAIARALAPGPDVLICDEITSALDVSVQAAIIDLLGEMQQAEGLSMLFITHNLALVRNICDRVMILNTGAVVESGPVEEVLNRPQHKYTRRLLGDTPSMFEREPGASRGMSAVGRASS